ncbi:MAG: hypothetical protein JWN30_1983 [Bacilli bacterium]|nr:hypothetical protein [Bacilli bacterium]
MKLNRLRNLALGLIFFGFIVMIFGFMLIRLIFPGNQPHPNMTGTLFLIGLICCLISVVMYFRLGVISIRIPQVECPSCHRMTKMLGTEDGCMFCGTPVSILDGHSAK